MFKLKFLKVIKQIVAARAFLDFRNIIIRQFALGSKLRIFSAFA